MTDCHICGGIRHDEEMHAAAVNVRRYLLDRLLRSFEPVSTAQKTPSATTKVHQQYPPLRTPKPLNS